MHLLCDRIQVIVQLNYYDKSNRELNPIRQGQLLHDDIICRKLWPLPEGGVSSGMAINPRPCSSAVISSHSFEIISRH